MDAKASIQESIHVQEESASAKGELLVYQTEDVLLSWM